MSIEDQIDRAVADWSVSDDAMRWTPDEPTGTDRADFNFVVFDEVGRIAPADRLGRVVGYVLSREDFLSERYRTPLWRVDIA